MSILLGESEAADSISLFSMSFVEWAIVFESRDPVRGGRRLDAFLQEAKVIVETINLSQAMLPKARIRILAKDGTGLV